MFDNDEYLKNVQREHRLKIIEHMNFREYSDENVVLQHNKEQSEKIIFCIKG